MGTLWAGEINTQRRGGLLLKIKVKTLRETNFAEAAYFGVI